MKVAVNNRHQNDDSLRLSIKDEIRHQIQNRRLSQGLEKLEVDFIPKPKYPLTPEEEYKVKIRKEHNQKSAKKCRLRKQQLHSIALLELKKLEEKNVKLKKTISRFESEKEYYMNNICKVPRIVSALTEVFKDELDSLSNLVIFDEYSLNS